MSTYLRSSPNFSPGDSVDTRSHKGSWVKAYATGGYRDRRSTSAARGLGLFFSQGVVFVALAAASPVAKRAVYCSLVLTPTAALSSSNLTTEFNYTLGRSLGIAVGGTIYNGGSTYTDNGDGTYNVATNLAAQGVSDEEVAAIITGWVGETLTGLVSDWHVDSVTCP
ncbi:hypothetical protein Hypma_014295 [Hypsizygus marmoreus]|uniref:Uncharacterized protein n=1 Tax=Hypsizygus marmoreus TaxID=39966 RepID=A0A369JEE5_HYPMA|nr:hypothetical protein Hypma_014295 [Hypsizygus marmoreus]